ncbi:hypothetical protein PoB_001381600 [Plakobranchus ocellatus]|uniref:Uncharacterized protein n=1 Tax=Plakobranchus ocellatus TaxID=259542 RepID=A0AAV3YY62_9GAST|nr:hypothetical protein PoB_001381600 [Plakobranchus ocellatus]
MITDVEAGYILKQRQVCLLSIHNEHFESPDLNLYETVRHALILGISSSISTDGQSVYDGQPVSGFQAPSVSFVQSTITKNEQQ